MQAMHRFGATGEVDAGDGRSHGSDTWGSLLPGLSLVSAHHHLDCMPGGRDGNRAFS